MRRFVLHASGLATNKQRFAEVERLIVGWVNDTLVPTFFGPQARLRESTFPPPPTAFRTGADIEQLHAKLYNSAEERKQSGAPGRLSGDRSRPSSRADQRRADVSYATFTGHTEHTAAHHDTKMAAPPLSTPSTASHEERIVYRVDRHGRDIAGNRPSSRLPVSATLQSASPVDNTKSDMLGSCPMQRSTGIDTRRYEAERQTFALTWPERRPVEQADRDAGVIGERREVPAELQRRAATAELQWPMDSLEVQNLVQDVLRERSDMTDLPIMPETAHRWDQQGPPITSPSSSNWTLHQPFRLDDPFRDARLTPEQSPYIASDRQVTPFAQSEMPETGEAGPSNYATRGPRQDSRVFDVPSSDDETLFTPPDPSSEYSVEYPSLTSTRDAKGKEKGKAQDKGKGKAREVTADAAQPARGEVLTLRSTELNAGAETFRPVLRRRGALSEEEKAVARAEAGEHVMEITRQRMQRRAMEDAAAAAATAGARLSLRPLPHTHVDADVRPEDWCKCSV